LSGHVDLSPEEAQYWTWSKFLDVYYYSKPPLIAYFNYFSTFIFGINDLGVRINAVIIGALLSFLVYYFSLSLFKDEKIAFLGFLSLFFTPAYNLSSVLFLTDTLLVLFFFIYVVVLYKLFEEKKNIFYVLLSLSLGLGLLSKQIMILAVFITFLIIFLRKREFLKDVKLYLSLICGLLIGLIPFLIWNIQHDFATLKHLLFLSGVEGQEKPFSKSLQYIGDYIVSQIAINSIFLFPFLVFAVYKGFGEKDDFKKFFLLVFPIFTFIFFFFIAFKHRVYGNWPAFSYITLYIILGFYILKKNWFKSFFAAGFLSLVSVFILFYTPIIDKIGLTNLLPPEKDPTKRLVGWKDLSNFVQNIRKEYPDSFLFSDDYFISSELMFYLKDHPFVYCINTGRRKNQWDFWESINSEKNKRKTGIYVTGANLQPLVKEGFERFIKKYRFDVKYRGTVVNSFNIYVLQGFKKIKEINVNRY
jgi:4-amino-4-deoxy-L-arabinose transferase-like glycosyltransferase